MSQSNVRLVGPAQPASHPYKPNLPLNLAIGAFGGLVLAIGYVMLREQTSSVLRAPGEAGSWLALPELGAIPMAANQRIALLSSASFPGATRHPGARRTCFVGSSLFGGVGVFPRHSGVHSVVRAKRRSSP